MRVFNRQFDEAQKDFQKMLTFLIDDYADKQNRYIWSATRLGGWVSSLASGYGNFFPSYMKDNAQLWFNNIEELVGFAISENGNADFFVMVRRGHEFLYSEIIEWVKVNWNDKKGILNTQTDENQYIFMRALYKAGFKKGDISQVSRQYDLLNMDLSVLILPKSIVIKDMLAYPNEYGIRLLRNNAFRGTNEVSDFDLARQKFGNESPFYFPQFDIYAQNQDNLIIAGCVGLVDYKNNYAEIEVVGTHNEYRRRGLAQTVIIECMRRLRDDGVKYAYISGYSEAAINLYGKFKFTTCRNWYGFSMK
jgi:ribosomal protein S18 acetylase RimI-like enzyme